MDLDPRGFSLLENSEVQSRDTGKTYGTVEVDFDRLDTGHGGKFAMIKRAGAVNFGMFKMKS